MICFPLDNTEYEANALGAWCGTRTRGVFAADGHYSVTANDDMTVTVNPGLAWLKAGQFWGVNAFEPNAQVLTLDTADGSLARIDAVCVRLDKNQNRGEIIIKKGGYSPQPPAITPPVRDLDYDEIYVATIMVRAGATAILAADITDQRLNEDYCGIMRDGVTGIPTQQLQAQWLDWLSQFTAEARAHYQQAKDNLADWATDFTTGAQEFYRQYQGMVTELYTQYAADVAVHGENAQQVFDSYTQRMSNFEDTAQTEFEEWFAGVRGILDQEAAGHLLNLIEALPDSYYTKESADRLRDEAVASHNANPAAHGAILQRVDELAGRCGALELITGPAIGDNPFTVTFRSLDGLEVDGVWNAALTRIEF